MSTAFRRAHDPNGVEIKRLGKLIQNLQLLNKFANLSDVRSSIRPRLEALKIRRNKRPNIYNIKKILQKDDELQKKQLSRMWMYGYIPRPRNNWVVKKGLLVPPNLPDNEVLLFRRPRLGMGENQFLLKKNTTLGRFRNMFTQEGTLKPVSGKRPVPFVPKKPVHGFLPTLRELAWKAKSSNENFETMKTMNNKQLKLLSKAGPINWTLLKPAKRATPLPANNVTAYRRHAAARTIQKAVKKYQKKHPKPPTGLTPRSPVTIAREMALGMAGGARRPPGTANNTRVTWSRNANGKISIHKTIRNLNLSLSNAERRALEKMSENKAMNYIRNLARQ